MQIEVNEASSCPANDDEPRWPLFEDIRQPSITNGTSSIPDDCKSPVYYGEERL